MLQLLIIYLLIINVIAFAAYGIDKYKAVQKKWRIPEATLLGLAALGGAIGAWAGMRVFHHKTLHKQFAYGVPIMLLIQVALICWLMNNGILS